MKFVKNDVHELSIEHDLAILMIVGEGMNKVIGTANKITHALAESKINLKMINQGASENLHDVWNSCR